MINKKPHLQTQMRLFFETVMLVVIPMRPCGA